MNLLSRIGLGIAALIGFVVSIASCAPIVRNISWGMVNPGTPRGRTPDMIGLAYDDLKIPSQE